ncbi:MAG TPA: PAS domain-containing protein, partial [Spirochaetia bacterium]|nr:PAS domain-containing protein [Spirochaetia bacterium]
VSLVTAGLTVAIAAALAPRILRLRSERQRAQSREKESARILANLIESTTDAFFVKDRDLRMVLCNSVQAAFVGKQPAELYGKSDLESGWDSDQVKGNPQRGIRGWEQDDRAALAGRTVRSVEQVTGSGEVRYLDTLKVPLRDERGDVVGVIGLSRDITDRKRMEEDLRESQERLRQIFEHAPVAIAVLDRDMRYLMVSRRWLTDFGLTQAEVVGRSHYEMFPDIPERWKEIHRRCLAGATESADEDPFPRADGTVEWVKWEIRPWFTQTKEIGGIYIFSENLTQRRQLQQILQKERSMLLTLVNGLPDRIFAKDRESRFILANQAAASSMGVGEPSDLLGKTDHDFLDAAVADPFRAMEKRIVEEGRGLINFEESGRNASGTFWTLTTKLPFRDESGRIAGLVGIGRDITEQKLASQKLAEQAALLDITADAVLVRDLDDRIVYWNRGAERMYGWPRQEALGKRVAELIGEDMPDLASAHRQVLERGSWEGEFRRKTREGRILRIEARWNLLRDEAGAPKGILSVNTDVTERRAIQAQFFRVQRLESLGTLAGGIAHDLNNVLAPILMGIEGLSLRHQDDDNRRITDIMRSAAQRGAGVIRQILSFARGASGERAEVQLRHVVSEIEDMIRETFPRSIEIRSEVTKDLSPVLADATQMHQVLMNLCVNARDAMPGGGTLFLAGRNVRLDEEFVRHHIEAQPIPYVMIEVRDTGTGMLPEVQEKIFEPFFTTKDPGKGTGLGLSTTRTIVKSHGGFLSFYSEPGHGTSFRVYIPAANAADRSQDAGSTQALPEGRGQLILVVDDEPSIREMCLLILQDHGYEVMTATGGEQALAAFSANSSRVRLVITDMMMPGMDGAEVIRGIRRMDPRVRIIASSGLAAWGESPETATLGVNGFLPKPYTAETLLGTLGAVLGSDA